MYRVRHLRRDTLYISYPKMIGKNSENTKNFDWQTTFDVYLRLERATAYEMQLQFLKIEWEKGVE